MYIGWITCVSIVSSRITTLDNNPLPKPNTKQIFLNSSETVFISFMISLYVIIGYFFECSTSRNCWCLLPLNLLPMAEWATPLLLKSFCYDISKSDLSLDKIKYRVALIGHELVIYYEWFQALNANIWTLVHNSSHIGTLELNSYPYSNVL